MQLNEMKTLEQKLFQGCFFNVVRDTGIIPHIFLEQTNIWSLVCLEAQFSIEDKILVLSHYLFLRQEYNSHIV